MERSFIESTVNQLRTFAESVLSLSKQLIEENTKLPEEIQRISLGAENMLTALENFLRIFSTLEEDQIKPYLKTARHDLRSPINAISGYTEMSMEDLIDSKNDKDLIIAHQLQPILEMARQMLSLIDGLKEDSEFLSFDNTIKSPGGSILIVDDVESNRALLETWLKRKNYETCTAKNGIEALSILDEKPTFDIVLLDVMMPGIGGLEVLKKIKSDERFESLIVIMISAADEMEGVVDCIKFGAIDYLIKPFNPYLLDARISSCLQNKRLVKLFQERLIAQEKLAALGGVTSGIAHEIKNPLNFIINFSELSLDLIKELEKEGDSRIQSLKANLEVIKNQSKQANEIIQRMFALSSFAKEGYTQVNLNQLITTAYQVTYSEFQSKNKGFVVDYSSDFDLTFTSIDVIQKELFFVLMNIFNNAFHALLKKEQPKMSVITKKIPLNKFVIEIRDNGKGIAEEDQLKIFTPFFTTKAPGEGVGLGLSLSYSIITQLHKGTLSFESKQNKFTKFTITLPIKKNEI